MCTACQMELLTSSSVRSLSTSTQQTCYTSRLESFLHHVADHRLRVTLPQSSRRLLWTLMGWQTFSLQPESLLGSARYHSGKSLCLCRLWLQRMTELITPRYLCFIDISIFYSCILFPHSSWSEWFTHQWALFQSLSSRCQLSHRQWRVAEKPDS